MSDSGEQEPSWRPFTAEESAAFQDKLGPVPTDFKTKRSCPRWGVPGSTQTQDPNCMCVMCLRSRDTAERAKKSKKSKKGKK